MDTRLRASPRARRGKEVFLFLKFLVIRSATGAPSGAAAVIVINGEGDKNPVS